MATPRHVTYGDHPSQHVELWAPERGASGGADGETKVAVLLHGGYWRKRFGCDLMHPMARRLAHRGWRVVNVEYRRVGEVDDPWPAMAHDVEAAFEVGLAGRDGDPVVIVGHSAGGQLALWAASLTPHADLAGVAALAPVADLETADRLGLSDHAVRELLGDGPGVRAERIRSVSPVELVPLGVRQLVVHGHADANVPLSLSTDYVAAARAAGDTVTLHDPPDVDHFDIIDPTTDVWAVVETTMAAWVLEESHG